MNTVLITGGAGYIGSHCAKAFNQAGWRVVCLDNLSRGFEHLVKWGDLVRADIADRPLVLAALERYQPDIVVHAAAYAYVGESVSSPELYYENNSQGTLSLLQTLSLAGAKKIVFSSTCATYGNPQHLPIDETHPQVPINPYGWSKFIIERMLEDFAVAHQLRSITLRYFNAAGADPDGEIGECHEPETHAVPLAIRAALDVQPFRIFGTDFGSSDGTAVRDYIHVCDLAQAHVLAADRLLRTPIVAPEFYNLGTGTGVSIRALLEAVERVTGQPVPRIECAARPGDPAILVAAAKKAYNVLGWRPTASDISNIVETAVAWERKNRARTLLAV